MLKIDMSGLDKLAKNVNNIPKNQTISMPLPSNWDLMTEQQKENYKNNYAVNVIKQQMFKGIK